MSQEADQTPIAQYTLDSQIFDLPRTVILFGPNTLIIYSTRCTGTTNNMLVVVGFMQIGVNDGEGDDNEVEGVDGALRHRICER